MIYLCSDCGNEFEGDEGTSKCPNCNSGRDALVLQAFSVLSELDTYRADD